MITYLKGILVSKTENSPSGCHIIIEVNNIGYFILTNKRVIDSLPENGELVTIYTTLIHKEDSMTLCGFDSREDRDLFNLLQSVSGVGTKVALLLLGEFCAYDLVSAVIKADDKTLSKTKGVGPKLAQRIILELKDKMVNWRDKTLPSSKKKNVETKEINESYTEAESVLLSLGYSKEEASEGLDKALSTCQNPNDSEELLRISLQWLASQ